MQLCSVAFVYLLAFGKLISQFFREGDVAQLARALDWQSRGRRFEPDLLHELSEKIS